MNLTVFMTLLMVCAVVTSLLTESVKAFFEENGIKYASNIIVLVLAMLTGCAGAMFYYWAYAIEITVLNCIMAIFLGLANWVGAMVGYDKVKQCVEQISKIGG